MKKVIAAVLCLTSSMAMASDEITSEAGEVYAQYRAAAEKLERIDWLADLCLGRLHSSPEWPEACSQFNDAVDSAMPALEPLMEYLDSGPPSETYQLGQSEMALVHEVDGLLQAVGWKGLAIERQEEKYR